MELNFLVEKYWFDFKVSGKRKKPANSRLFKTHVSLYRNGLT